MHPELRSELFPYHYRLPVSIALAETARQIGRRIRPILRRPPKREPLYDHTLEILLEERGDVVYLEELSQY